MPFLDVAYAFFFRTSLYTLRRNSSSPYPVDCQQSHALQRGEFEKRFRALHRVRRVVKVPMQILIQRQTEARPFLSGHSDNFL